MLTLTLNTSQIKKAFKDAPGLVDKATKSAIYNVATDKRFTGGLDASLKKVLDRPTPFTAGRGLAWYVTPPPKDGPIVATIGMKRVQAAYLQFVTRGRARDEKIIERRAPDGRLLVPTSAVTLDQYGNIPRREYLRIMKQAFKRRDSTAEFFFLPQRRGKLAAGVYKRTEDGVVPWLLAVETAQYRKQFDFDAEVTRLFNQLAPEAIQEAIRFRLAQAK